MFYVYVLRSFSKNRAYIGHTANLRSRLAKHNSGSVKSTKFCNDWILIYSEQFSTRSLAIKRERFFKTGDGRKVLKYKNIPR
jgi:putative endonuclease